MTGWVAVFNTGKKIEQYPESGEDNTLELSKYVIPNQRDLSLFVIEGEFGKIGIDFNRRTLFYTGDFYSYVTIPFYSDQKDIDLVYFITRTVVSNSPNPEEGEEQERVFTVGYKDKNGKMFLNVYEDRGLIFISNCNI